MSKNNVSTLFPGILLVVIANGQNADSENEPVGSFFQGVPLWVWLMCFAVLGIVCVGALCDYRYNVMAYIEAQMMSDRAWTEEIFLAMHKCEPPPSPQSENVSVKLLPLEKRAMGKINFAGVFSTANLIVRNQEASGQKNPKVFSDFKLTELEEKETSVDSVLELIDVNAENKKASGLKSSKTLGLFTDSDLKLFAKKLSGANSELERKSGDVSQKEEIQEYQRVKSAQVVF